MIRKYLISLMLILFAFNAFGQSKKANVDDLCLDLTEASLEEIKENCNNISFLSTFLEKYKECNGSIFYMEASLCADNLSPSYLSSIGCYNYFYKKNKISKAIDYLEQAIDFSQDSKVKSDLYLNMAWLYGEKLKNFQRARNSATMAINVLPDNVSAYIFMAKLYASSKVSGNDVINSSKYWLAVDVLDKAKELNITEEEKNLVERLRREYYLKFPTKEQIETVRNMNEGKIYRVGGWIGRATVCRSRK